MEQHPHRRPTPCTAQSRAEQLRTAQPQASRTVHVVENFDDFAYPYGDNNENAWAAMEEAGVLCAFTIENRRVEVGDPVESLPRVRIAGEYTQEGFEYLVEPNGGEQ